MDITSHLTSEELDKILQKIAIDSMESWTDNIPSCLNDECEILDRIKNGEERESSSN